MATTPPSNPKADLTQSEQTIPSDSENYSSSQHPDLSPSPEPQEKDQNQRRREKGRDHEPMILYTPPTIWGLLRGAAINLLLPFVNGLMLGFGELFAHEAAFRLGWGGTKVRKFGLALLAASGLVDLIKGEERGVRGWL